MEKDDLILGIRELFPDGIDSVREMFGDQTLVIRREILGSLLRTLKEPPFNFGLLLDVTCVDFTGLQERFEMIYHLYSLENNRRLRIKLSLPRENPAVESIAGLWKNVNWLEREVYDMFGVTFEGHPDLRRILMYEGFEGHPLRKSYPLKKRQPRIPMED